MRTLAALKGRIVWFDWGGSRGGKVVSVEHGPRIGFRSFHVCLGTYKHSALCYEGRKIKLPAKALVTPPGSGVMFRRKLIPFTQWYGGCPRHQAKIRSCPFCCQYYPDKET